jgi:hypothetical protein
MEYIALPRPTANTLQGNIVLQTVQQLPRITQVVDGFGHKGAGDGPPMQGWTAHAAVPRANHSLDLYQFKHRDQLPQLAGQRPQRLLQHREQTTLHHAKKLLQLAGEGKLHKVGFLYIGS